MTPLSIAALGVITWGVHAQVPLVWNAADAAMAMMATLNLVALLGLSGVVVKLTRDYEGQLRAGRSPVFHAADYPELGEGIDRSIWRDPDADVRAAGGAPATPAASLPRG